MISSDGKLIAVHDKLDKQIQELQLKHGINGKKNDMYDDLKARIDDLKLKEGVDGINGKDGIDGNRGDKGFQGDRGYKGDQGDQGSKGFRGEQGIRGGQGLQGDDGTRGFRGTEGLNGVDGVSVIKVEIAFDNHLVVYLSDGREIDAGKIRGGSGSGGGDQYFRSGSKVSINPSEPKGTEILDFGSGSNFATLVVLDDTIKETHKITVELSTEATVDHPLDDLLYDPIRVTTYDILDGVGFSIFGQMANAEANGTYNINWYAR
jgi:hypothetical protein